MSYMLGRIFQDAAGYLYREHRPGWVRRVSAPVIPSTEHPIVPNVLEYVIGSGLFVVEEEP